jgi:putative selenium metabolism hydrolase
MIDAKALRRAVRKYEGDIVRFARRIVATPSFSGREGRLACLIQAEMRRAGFESAKIDSMGNVVGRVGAGPVKILMDAHIDTVGIGDRSAWKWDPFKGKLQGGRIYGRGATDQKLSVASMVYAARVMKDLGLGGGATVWMAGTCLEEDCDGLPLLHLIGKEGYRPDFVVITEPTDLRVYRGHRGRMEMKVTAKGRSCHASAPERGDNAVAKMAPVISEITALGPRLKDDPFLGRGSVAVTKVECQTPSLNAVPDECVVYLDRRLTAGETMRRALSEIAALPSVRKAKARVEVLRYEAVCWTGLKVGQEKYFPTWVLSDGHPLVRAAVGAARLALGREPGVGKWTFSTNGVASAGRLGIPTVGFGPGDEVHAHTVGEFMPVEDLLKAAAFYAALPEFLAAGK